MTSQNIYRALGGLDSDLILKAAPQAQPTRRRPHTWIRWSAIAACLVVTVLTVPRLLDWDVVEGELYGNSTFSLYSLTQSNGQSYLEIAPSSATTTTDNYAAELRFDTIEEWVDAVTNYKLEEWQLETIQQTFPKDSDGNILVCDFNNLYAPLMPKNFHLDEVQWIGEHYAYFLSTAGQQSAVIHVLPEETYRENFAREYKTFFERESIRVTNTKTVGKTTEYEYSTSGGQFKNIRYNFTEGETTYTIDEFYRLSTNRNDPSIQTSATVPYRIMIYGETGDAHFITELYHLTEAPSKEFLTSFGLSPYSKP